MACRHTLWIGLALLTSGCLGRDDSKWADAAVDRFYQHMAAKQYQAIYAEASPEFRASMAPDLFGKAMQRIDRKLGACQPPVKQPNWNVNATTNGYFRTQGYRRVCANGQLNETVTTVVRDGDAKLGGYYANSPLLLTD
jgi:hypothetical protein